MRNFIPIRRKEFLNYEKKKYRFMRLHGKRQKYYWKTAFKKNVHGFH